MSNWVRELPTQAGWYWVCWSNGKKEVVRVVRRDDASPNWEWWVCIGNDVYRYAERVRDDGTVVLPLRWSEPIKEP